MYLSFYRLTKEPFHITPDPEFLYLSPSHKQALGSVIYGIEQRKGFIAITGEVGVGKTTILRSYLDRVDRQRLKIIYVFNANVPFQGLLKTIYRELGLAPASNDLYEMVNQLHELLIEQYRQNQNVVLIIDEAQNMPVATLENLRMLSNLETSKDKLIQILLVGQPEFERKLDLNELRQLKQRIAIRCKILPLTVKDSLAYIQHRLARASRKNAVVFSNAALRLIVKQARGIPRILNVLCDNALITGFGYQQQVVSAKIVKEIMTDFEDHCPNHRRRFRFPLSALLFPFRRGSWNNDNPPPAEDLETVFTTAADLNASTQLRPEPAPLLPTGGSLPPASVAEQAIRAVPLQGQDSRRDQESSHPKEPSRSRAPVNKSKFIYRFMRQGEQLTTLVARVYGHCNDQLIEMIKQENPRIIDVNHIKAGEIIRFPDLE